MELVVGVIGGAAAFFGLGRFERAVKAHRDRALLRGDDRRNRDRNFSEDEVIGFRAAVGERPDSIRLRDSDRGARHTSDSSQ